MSCVFCRPDRECNIVCLCTEFFEELLSLIYSLTSRQISARMWQILPHLYRLFFDDNIDLFVGE